MKKPIIKLIIKKLLSNVSFYKFGLLTAGLVLASTAYAAGDPVAGQHKAETCLGCHAIPTYFNVYPSYRVPKLAGQHPEYIVAALKGYKDNTRKHDTMHANAANLTEQDMLDIAAFLTANGQDVATLNNKGDVQKGEKIATGTCLACHGKDGNSPSAAFPNIAGQYADYIVESLKAYKSGARQNPIMTGFVGGLTEEDMWDVAAYYSSQKGLDVVKEVKIK